MRPIQSVLLMLLVLLAGIPGRPTPAGALPALSELGKNLTLSANASGMWLGREGGGSSWNGADIGGALTANLHEMFSVYAAYDHGFPFRKADPHMSFVRVAANLRVYPQRYGESDERLFVGLAKSWFGEADVKDAQTLDAQLTGTHKLGPRLFMFGMYSHAFAINPGLQADRNYAKVGLNLKLAP